MGYPDGKESADTGAGEPRVPTAMPDSIPAFLGNNDPYWCKHKDWKYARTKGVGKCRLEIHPIILSPDQCVSCTTASALQRRNRCH